jgi:hypothetical protein
MNYDNLIPTNNPKSSWKTQAMTTTPLTPSSFITTIITLSLLLGSAALVADQDGITDDGREVLLKEDGSWEFRSNDRYANTQDGQRVRLREDGSWEYVGNAPLVLKEQVRTTLLDFKLQRVDIEIHKEKVQKNVREEKQLVFYLDISVSPAAKESITINHTDLSLIQVTDNKGKSYPVLFLTPGHIVLGPDSQHSLAIRAKGAPSKWDGARSMELELRPGVLGNNDAVKLSQNISDFEKKYVKGFEKTKD